MGRGRRSKYSEEFKREAVRLVESGTPLEQVAIDLGVGKTTLWRWRAQYGEDVGAEESEVTEGEGLEKEIARLRKKLAQVEEERDVLKKAAAFFAKHSR